MTEPTAATAGAADPSGPFGRGRLKRGQRVTWFYCRLGEGGCQRTLALTARAGPGAVDVTVRGYDDEGGGVPIEGATVRAGAVSAVRHPGHCSPPARPQPAQASGSTRSSRSRSTQPVTPTSVGAHRAP